jgi:hypothetical protein
MPQKWLRVKMFKSLTLQDAERAIAVLFQTVAVCRGLLYSARSGDATPGEFERILDSTSGDTIKTLVGAETFQHVMRLAEALPPEDRDVLLSIRDEPY